MQHTFDFCFIFNFMFFLPSLCVCLFVCHSFSRLKIYIYIYIYLACIGRFDKMPPPLIAADLFNAHLIDNLLKPNSVRRDFFFF